MPKQSKAEKLEQSATFIFRGTVKKLKAATIPSVPVNDRTIIVHLDEVMRGPDALAQFAGSDITVQLGSRERVEKGERAIFYTNSWMLGESLAVQSVGHTAADAAISSAQVKGGLGLAESIEADPGLEAEVANADTVVTGRVTSIRAVDEPGPGEGTGLTLTTPFQPVSEHSPVWQEAVIEVSDVEKGKDIPKQIVVRFPSSTDVRWYDAPKFRPGQEGVFLLQHESKKRAVTARSKGVAASGSEPGAQLYTALGAATVQPIQKVEAIRTLIKAAK